MANTFKNFLTKDLTTTGSTLYSCPSDTQTTVIGFSISNTSSSPITADAFITSGGTDYYLIKSGVVPVGGSLVIVGGDQKVVLEASDVLKALASTTTTADAVVSVLEIA
jgi:hypothetical protein